MSFLRAEGSFFINFSVILRDILNNNVFFCVRRHNPSQISLSFTRRRQWRRFMTQTLMRRHLKLAGNDSFMNDEVKNAIRV